MAIAIRGSVVTASVASGVSSLDMVPSTQFPNDLYIALIWRKNTASSITSPSGWTRERSATSAIGGGKLAADSRVIDGSEGTTLTWTTTADSGETLGCLFSLSGVDITIPILSTDAAQGGTTTPSADSGLYFPPKTPPYLIFATMQTTKNPLTCSGYSNSMVERADFAQSLTSMAVASLTATLAQALASDTGTIQCTASQSSSFLSLILAVTPQVSPPFPHRRRRFNYIRRPW